MCHNSCGDPAPSIDYNIQETGDSSLTGLSLPPDIILYGEMESGEETLTRFYYVCKMTIVVLCGYERIYNIYDGPMKTLIINYSMSRAN